jgi:sugar/nucleoside kinase (ribokinase family)
MRRPILTVGAANAERLTEVEAIRLGEKHLTSPALLGGGGSAVNHACRLLAVGIPALPLFPLGDDEAGALVREALASAARTGALPEDEDARLRSWLDGLVQPGTTTGSSTVVVERGGRRTAFSEVGTASHGFEAVCRRCIEALDPESLEAVVVGHVHADAVLGGRITSGLLERFAGRTLVVANLGRSQYRLGSGRWLSELREVDVVQLSAEEAMEFAASASRPLSTLRAVAEWFQENGLTTVVTIDRFGAVGLFRGDSRVVLAWPYELGSAMRDGTGAGDAFAAGLAAFLARDAGGHATSIQQLRRAMEEARTWAAYACTRLGGASDCPTRQQLGAFTARTAAAYHVEVVSLSRADEYLRVLDGAFSRPSPA